MRFAPALALLLLLAAGCGRKDDVRHYTAPKDPSWRMVAAIVPSNDATWFFKVVAPTDRLGAHKDEVLAFFRTLRVEDNRIRWTLPPGWQEEKAGTGREASLVFGDRKPKLEVAVSRLPGDAGGLAANINRWRDQLGLDRVGESEAASTVQKIAGAGVEAQVVDLIGPTRPPAGGPRGMGRTPPPEAPRSGDAQMDNVRSLFTFDRPPSWKENLQTEKPRLFEFQVGEGGRTAMVTFIIMGGESGGLAANIDRWRQQAGLEPLGDQAPARSATPMRFLDHDGHLVEAIGQDRAILGVISLDAQMSMFLKMDGAPSVVAAQRETFLRVAQSFQMRGRHE